MKKYYYLHIWTGGEIDSNSIIADRSTHPYILTKVGLEIDEWPADDLFAAWPEYFASERLCAKLAYWGYTGLTFDRVEKITIGKNFEANYPKIELLSYYWLKVKGIAGQDDFGLWKRLYLIVSEKALDFLRDNHVIHAEAKEITVGIDEFFQLDEHKFWM